MNCNLKAFLPNSSPRALIMLKGAAAKYSFDIGRYYHQPLLYRLLNEI
jgi:hypothetical protein